MRPYISTLILFLFSVTVYADNTDADNVLTIDKPSISQTDLYFPETEHIQPDKSDFKIISSILLSSKSGKRTATVTFKNTSSGQRIMTNKDVLAVFANGQKKSPLTFKQKFSGKQKLSLNLNFGSSTYPILSVYTLNK